LIALVTILVAANLIFALHAVAAARRPFDLVIPREPIGEFGKLSIVVPARNEAGQIEACVRSLLAQRYPDLEVVVVDDCSEDATRSIVERIAAHDSRLTVVRGEPLPEGWVGKPWALVQGARVASGRWLLFTDVDTVHAPLSAATAMSVAAQRGLDALSILTEQDLITLPERALMPSLFFAILSGTGPIADVADPEKPDAALFNGQYILVSRAAYDAIGGHAAVRAEIAEDLELARLFKRSGRYRIALMASEGIARTRMYHSLAEIWAGFTKNFALGVRGRRVAAAAGVTLLCCISPLSPAALVWLAVGGHWAAAALLAASMLLALGGVAFAMRPMHLPATAALWFPLGVAFAVAVLGASILLFASGRGVRWRGRRYGGGFGKL
jgi:chlorobactene glucosyltransferase